VVVKGYLCPLFGLPLGSDLLVELAGLCCCALGELLEVRVVAGRGCQLALKFIYGFLKEFEGVGGLVDGCWKGFKEGNGGNDSCRLPWLSPGAAVARSLGRHFPWNDP
jgi:hypothetical protein